MKEYRAAIIGAGASGVMAALSAALNYPDAQFLLLERQDKLLRKVSAAGNGRCNLSNRHLAAQSYFSVATAPKQKAKTLASVFHRFSARDTVHFFQKLGLYCREDQAGRIYPYAEQSEVVVSALEKALHNKRVNLLCEAEVTAVRLADQGIHITYERRIRDSKQKYVRETVCCQDLIIACGSEASPQLGGSDLGYRLCAQLGLEVSALYPALVPLELELSKNEGLYLRGQRFKGAATLYKDNEKIFQTDGEFLFAETGISGIAAMELARFIQGSGHYQIALDFVPDLSAQELTAYISENQIQTENIPCAFVKTKIAEYLYQRSAKKKNPVQLLKDCHFTVRGTLEKERAQVIAGGVLLNQLYFPQFCLKRNPHIYLCGELLDLDGATGGYNLQWAWSSGYLAGKLEKPY